MTPSSRLRSLDALRGFDMLWIVGGAEVLRALAVSPGGWYLEKLAGHTHHAHWHGFKAWDGVFPLFLFLAGASLPFSFAARRRRGASEASLALHAVRRGALLVLLGVIYNGLLALDWEELRYASVLGRIGLAWMLAALVTLRYESTRALVLWVVGILVGYWALLTLVPVPGQGAASLEPGRTIVDWFDRRFLPGRLHRGVRDPEGLLGTIPAVATALLGVLTGRWLRSYRPPAAKAGRLALAGLALAALGLLWHPLLPLNKNLWTSSFVLLTGGCSAVMLAGFYWVIDVRGWRAWSFPLVVIGMNAITIYVLRRFVDFDLAGELLFAHATPERLHPAILAGTGLLLEWLLLYGLYRKGVFLKV